MAETITETISKPVHSAVAPSLVRADGRPADVVAFEESVTAFFLEAAELLGIPKSVAAIYGICFASAEPLSFSNVRDRLDLSAGSISQGLRILREVGALKVSDGLFVASQARDSSVGATAAPASLAHRLPRSCERFEPDLELRKLVTHYLEQRLEKQIHSGRGRLQAIGKAVPGGRNGSAKVLKVRLKALQAWHDKSRAVIPIIKGFLRLG